MTITETSTTGAELKLRLGGLGIPPSWFAARMNVTMRTVVRWFDGDVIESAVAAELESLSEATVAEMMKIIDKVPDHGPVVLKTYRTDKSYANKRGMPATWHRMLVFRLWEHFTAQERDVVVKYR